jgi:hypothetical protein
MGCVKISSTNYLPQRPQIKISFVSASCLIFMGVTLEFSFFFCGTTFMSQIFTKDFAV